MKGMEVEAKKKEEVTSKVFAEAGKLEVVFKELLLRGRRSINRTRGHLPPSGLNPCNSSARRRSGRRTSIVRVAP